MKRLDPQRPLLWLASLAALAGIYTLVSSHAARPDVLPSAQDIAETFTALLGSGQPRPMNEQHAHAGHHGHSSDQVETLIQKESACRRPSPSAPPACSSDFWWDCRSGP